MDNDENAAPLFQHGGTCFNPDGTTIDFGGTGLQHVLHRLGKYFKEHNQSEILHIPQSTPASHENQ
eukprot:10345459-Prorocentrum_lima.AAC.1